MVPALPGLRPVRAWIAIAGLATTAYLSLATYAIASGGPFTLLQEGEGTLDLATEPAGAEVFDGIKSIGTTPLLARKVRAGKLVLRIVHAEADDVLKEVEVRAGQSMDLGRIELPPLAFLDLTGLPEGVNAAIEGRALAGMVRRKSGVVSLTVSKAKQRDQVLQVVLVSGKVSTPTIGAWVPKPGRLDTSRLDGSVAIFIDGRVVERSNPVVPLEVGSHRYVLQRMGYYPVAEQVLEVGPDEAHSLPGVQWVELEATYLAMPGLPVPPPEVLRAARNVLFPPGIIQTNNGRIYCLADGAEMVVVPAGEFTMGKDGASLTRPAHKVHVSAFLIDRHEVTRGQYRRFCGDTARKYPEKWPDPASDADPATPLRHGDAASYAKWAGKRIPTEAEWEKAARGTDGREFPWGGADNKMVRNGPGGADGFEGLSAAGSFPLGASPYGCLDMAGNAEEWVLDYFDARYFANSPARDPQGALIGAERLLRGGSCAGPDRLLSCASRFTIKSSLTTTYSGFRTVVSLP